ncbi:hypothetical protein [Anaeroselena agilis]|uniref:Phage head morphogenesis domain-containing protein n=1 Tax=Anaeroselena agilis TaxID=3063788 RepID=A0ABU3NWH9_9FIRM|nr:hypothetical protein [Selenomonadales bacterium 4137-cl]
MDFAKKAKAAEYAPYLASMQRLLSARGLPAATISEMTNLQRLVPMFGGGLDQKIIDGVWNKVWPDALTVDDRIRLLSQRALKFSEATIKQGIREGKSAWNIMQELRGHFEVEGLERKAAFRLTAHTTNMVYHTAQAEISIQANFVMGIRIVRGMYGDADPTCDICDEHGGQDFKEYYKDDFGGRSYDLYVMANAPAYHVNCNCGVEDITEDAATFIQRAREENGKR